MFMILAFALSRFTGKYFLMCDKHQLKGFHMSTITL